MMTLEDEFQKPVHDSLAEIVIPGPLPDWGIYPPQTDYTEWLAQATYEADQVVTAAAICFDDIARGEYGSIHGQFPTPTPRKRKRVRNKK